MMSKLFMYGTELQEIEQLMVLVPKFELIKRRIFIIGRVVNVSDEYKKCIYCSHYIKGGCKEKHCPHLMERATLGQIK
nr:hypothetical protein [Sedimentibacter sp.]